MRAKWPSLPVAIMAAAFVLLPALRSDAAFIVQICGGACSNAANVVTVVDGSLGDTNLASGIIDVVLFGVGGFDILTLTASSKSALGEPSMTLDFVADKVSPTPGNLTLYGFDTDFTTIAPLSGHLVGQSSDSGSITGAIFGGVNNTAGTLANESSTSTVSFGGDFDTFDTTVLHSAAIVVPYSMTIGATLTSNVLSPSGRTRGRFEVGAVPANPEPPTPVPEPTSLILLATGLAGAVAFHRRNNLQA